MSHERAPGGLGFFNQLSRGGNINTIIGNWRALLTPLQSPVAGNRSRNFTGHLRHIKGWNAALVKNLQRLLPALFFGHNTGNHRFRRIFSNLGEAAGHAFGIDKERCNKIDKNNINPGVTHQGFSREFIVFRSCGCENINRIGKRGFRIEIALQAVPAGFADFREITAALGQFIGNNNSRATGVGDNPDPVSFSHRQLG